MIFLLLGFSAVTLAAIILPFIEKASAVRPTAQSDTYLAERKAAALAELRDLEFDYRLGKLSGADYEALRAQLARRAMVTLKALDDHCEEQAALEKALDDQIEQAVAERRHRPPAQPARVNGPTAASIRAPSPAPASPASPLDPAGICPECGHSAGPADRYCAQCGAALATVPRTNRQSPALLQQCETGRAAPSAIRQQPQVSRWLIAAALGAAFWVAVVGLVYFRTRAAFASQRPIARLTAIDRVALAILPADPNFVFFGDGGGLMWSSNGGVAWQPASIGGDVQAIAVHPAMPLRVFMAGRDLFLRSDDGGRNWEDVAAGLPGRDIRALAFGSGDPAALYAFITGYGLWRSQDDGASWTAVDTTLGEAVTALAIAPDVVYIGTNGAGVLASYDGGATWASANGIVNGALDSPRVRALAYDPATGMLYAGTDRGLSFTTSVGSGWTRRPFNGDVSALALGPDGTTMLLATSTGEVYRSQDRGVTWGK